MYLVCSVHWLLPTHKPIENQTISHGSTVAQSDIMCHNPLPGVCRPPPASIRLATIPYEWPPHNSEASDMRDVLSRQCWDITRKSTWIFNIWVRFVKYRSSLSCECNLHGYDRVVMKWEQYEVEDPKTLPPLHFQNFKSSRREKFLVPKNRKNYFLCYIF